MEKEPFIISCFTAEKDYSDLKLPTNHNKSDLEIVSDILQVIIGGDGIITTKLFLRKQKF